MEIERAFFSELFGVDWTAVPVGVRAAMLLVRSRHAGGVVDASSDLLACYSIRIDRNAQVRGPIGMGKFF